MLDDPLRFFAGAFASFSSTGFALLALSGSLSEAKLAKLVIVSMWIALELMILDSLGFSPSSSIGGEVSSLLSVEVRLGGVFLFS